MVDVLFGQSYYLRFDPKLWQAMEPYPPLGTLYAAALLRERGYDTALFDAMLADDESGWQEALKRERPRFAVLFEDSFNYLSKMCLLRMRQAALTMIAAAKRQGSAVLVCGSDASDHPEIYLTQGADFVLTGEGERTLEELVDRLDGRSERDLESIEGLVYSQSMKSKGDGTARALVRTPPREVMSRLDELPSPAWDLVDVDRYRRAWLSSKGRFSMNIATTRGCPYHCNWCAKPIWGQGYKMRSPASVAQEVQWLASVYAPDHLWFADDILGLKRGWIASFADQLEELGVLVPFKCQSRVDLLLRPGEVDALRRAGAETVWVGAESGSQRILDAMDKGTRVEQIGVAAERLHEAGIRIGFFLQFGYPGETAEDIEKTFQLVRDCEPDEIGMSVSYPLPGTRFFEMVQEQLGTKRNWVDSEDLDMMYSGPFSTAFYRQLYRLLHREFRARRRATELKRRLRLPRELALADLREAAVLIGQRASLPWLRYRMRRLQKVDAEALPSLDSGMSSREAAVPSPQS